MSDISGSGSINIKGSVGAGGVNATIDTYTVQFLLNAARARVRLSPIAHDGDVGPETIGAIRDFQIKSFGTADGRVDVGGRSLRRLAELYAEPDLVAPRTYVRGRHNRYRVVVGQDGRIFARPGDWLSKYSAAIYNDYVHIYDFGRMENGTLHLLRNPNLIRAGEVLYHIPTWRKFMGDKIVKPLPMPPILHDEEKARISNQATRGDFQLRGDYGFKAINAIEKGFEYGAPVADVVTVAAEVFTRFGAAAEIGGSAVAIAAIPFEIYGMIKDFCDASDTDLRMYGIRGAAYAITAWAFGDVIPIASPLIRGRMIDAHNTPSQGRRLDDSWRDAGQAAVALQERFAREQLGAEVQPDKKKLAWQASLRACGDESRAQLSLAMMKALGKGAFKDAVPAVQRAWEAGYDVLYPA